MRAFFCRNRCQDRKWQVGFGRTFCINISGLDGSARKSPKLTCDIERCIGQLYWTINSYIKANTLFQYNALYTILYISGFLVFWLNVTKTTTYTGQK